MFKQLKEFFFGKPKQPEGDISKCPFHNPQPPVVETKAPETVTVSVSDTVTSAATSTVEVKTEPNPQKTWPFDEAVPVKAAPVKKVVKTKPKQGSKVEAKPTGKKSPTKATRKKK